VLREAHLGSVLRLTSRGAVLPYDSRDTFAALFENDIETARSRALNVFMLCVLIASPLAVSVGSIYFARRAYRRYLAACAKEDAVRKEPFWKEEPWNEEI